MGHRGRDALPAPIQAGDDTVSLEEEALEWIAPYWNANHLVRTRDWLLELEPDAPEGLRLAALTHDMERHFPGDVGLPGKRLRAAVIACFDQPA